MASPKRKALGRGLNEVLDGADDVLFPSSMAPRLGSSISEIDIDDIYANPDQPRRTFDEDALQELAASIAEIGIIQPITLRDMNDGTYQIIAGERRYRASQIAGLDSVPAYIRTADDETMMSMALIENIQREDLNAVEIALAYQKLIDEHSLTQEQLSDRVGKKRATITNYLRLLKLSAPAQMALRNRDIEMGHARALLGIQHPQMQVQILQETIKNHYSVRQLERIVKEINAQNEGAIEDNKSEQTSNQLNNEVFALLKQQLSGFFSTSVQLSCNKQGKGKISIPFKNEGELEKIMELFDTLKK